MTAFQSRNTETIGARTIARFGGHPVALAAVALVILLVGAGSVALWRATTGNSPETDRSVSARQIQARAAQASEQLVEKTKALDLSQQEAIDQLQALQDQMLTVKRLLAAQQGDTKRLSDQVGELTTAIEGLRQSFASAQPADTPSEPSARHSTSRARSHHAQRNGSRKHSRS
jgi:chromosome segregation ATPase